MQQSRKTFASGHLLDLGVGQFCRLPVFIVNDRHNAGRQLGGEFIVGALKAVLASW